MFKRKRDVPKAEGFSPFLGPIFPPKNQNIAKNQNFFQKLHPYDYQITQSQVPDKSQNSYKIDFKKIGVRGRGKYGRFKVKIGR